MSSRFKLKDTAEWTMFSFGAIVTGLALRSENKK
jgi:hypothetical protein